MKKRLLILAGLLAILMVGCSNEKQEEKSNSFDKISNDEASSDELEPEVAVEKVCAYKIIETVYDSEGGLERKFEIEYDSTGNKLKETFYHTNGNKAQYIIYEYNILDKLIRDTMYTSDGSEVMAANTHTYNEQGDEILNISKRIDELTVEKYEYVYDDSDAIVNVTMHKDDEFSYELRYTYDQKGNVLEQGYYDENGEYNSGYEYTYDEKGNMIKEKHNSESSNFEVIRTYDDIGNLIEKKTYENGRKEASLWYKYEYDSNGNKIKSSSLESDGSIKSYEIYKYDEKGREIKCTSYSLDGLDYIREYEYIEME